MRVAGRFLRRAPALAAVVLLAACAGAPAPAPPAPRLPPELRPFLPDPAALEAGASASAVAALHRRLLAGEDPSIVRQEAEALAAPPPPALRLLLAEAALAAGDPARALDVAATIPGSPEAELVAGRAAELTGDPVAAVERYRAAASRFAVAAERRASLEPAAVAELRGRIEDLLARRQVEGARVELRKLATWRGGEPETWRLATRVARAAGDRRAELEALRTLAAAGEEPHADRLRRASLEVELGDAAAGLAMLESIVAARPDDAEVHRAWARARLHFRLANAPETVRRAGAATVLSRADFALLLYWLVPEVRAGRGGTPRIATDILDHPAREEIVRVANLGLLRVDEDLHLFEPDRALRRVDAFRALARVADGAVAGERADVAGRREQALCDRAAASGWIPEAGECLPSAAVSGAEALDWLRDAVEPAAEEPAP
jgi:hypothetical protein